MERRSTKIKGHMAVLLESDCIKLEVGLSITENNHNRGSEAFRFEI